MLGFHLLDLILVCLLSSQLRTGSSCVALGDKYCSVRAGTYPEVHDGVETCSGSVRTDGART